MKLSDLHTHPSLKPFQNRNEPNNTFQDMWNGVIGRNSLFFKIGWLVRSQIKETARDSQSHLNEFISGGMQTACVVVHPVEQGWFMRPKRKGRWFFKLIFKLLLNDRKLAVLAASLTGIPLDETRKLILEGNRFSGTDYFSNQTFPEYEYIRSQENKIATFGHTYELVKDFKSYEKAKDAGKIPLFLSVEGGHALLNYTDGKMFRKEYEELSEEERKFLKDDLVRNIARIKGEEGSFFSPNHTPIYLTLTHMYQNHLAGHCRSFTQGGTLTPGIADLLDQTTGLNKGLTDLGRTAIDLLTSTENGARILIDVKHLSVSARKEYYEIAREKNLPVIGSHVAMAGVGQFPDDPGDRKKDHDSNFFSRWSINFSDEDAQVIHETDGIVGFAIHEGRMPGGKAAKRLKKIKKHIKNGIELEETLRAAYMKILMSNVFQFVYAIGEKAAWTRMMIGSDYDGIMDPFDIYPKTSYFNRFIYDFQQFLESPQELVASRNDVESTLSVSEIKDMMHGYTAAEICEMVALKNFENFISRHF
ncbi:MAG: membrane dipeptidase [Bacteroidota bacterium]